MNIEVISFEYKLVPLTQKDEIKELEKQYSVKSSFEYPDLNNQDYYAAEHKNNTTIGNHKLFISIKVKSDNSINEISSSGNDRGEILVCKQSIYNFAF